MLLVTLQSILSSFTFSRPNAARNSLHNSGPDIILFLFTNSSSIILCSNFFRFVA